MMRHSDIRINSDKLGYSDRMSDSGKKRGRYGAEKVSNDRKWVQSSLWPLYQLSWAVWGQNKTQKCVCEQVSRANKGHNRQSDIRFPTESLFSKEVDSG